MDNRLLFPSLVSLVWLTETTDLILTMTTDQKRSQNKTSRPLNIFSFRNLQETGLSLCSQSPRRGALQTVPCPCFAALYVSSLSFHFSFSHTFIRCNNKANFRINYCHLLPPLNGCALCLESLLRLLPNTAGPKKQEEKWDILWKWSVSSSPAGKCLRAVSMHIYSHDDDERVTQAYLKMKDMSAPLSGFINLNPGVPPPSGI